jgi:hypothetical protein
MTTLSLPDFPHQQPESSQSTPTADYLLLDLFGTVVEVRRMSSKEARDAKLELAAQHGCCFHWVSITSMTD